ncbi:aldehyde dehydrogenase family protein [Candidimonas nitroreducens]|uniref:Aldehyde dehydrogenase n=1 Tax=Candidimonas nitroreducens TaxID=683354 RepID=A0A225MKI0_9BURK|nr:aldehyde dehydrogenase family protein [Candidimonas nitroreducens]OWT61887.1 aldehyde dehydrogenase [Candidimonas nitroreducens]
MTSRPNWRNACLINGAWVRSDAHFDVLDKYTLQPIAQMATASPAQIDAALAIARGAVDRGAPPPAERAAVLRRVAALLAERRNDFVELLVKEAGFTAADANSEAGRAIITLTLSADEATRLTGGMVPFGATPGAEDRIGFTLRLPVGVVCAITPFNSPLNTVLHKIAPAYAGGNAVVLKPSALTPLTAGLLAQTMLDAGMPADFLSVLQGSGQAVGEHLLRDPRIDFYAFTGSTQVGRRIQQAAGLRRTQMELGSIASTIVDGDAILERAVPKIVGAAFRKAGQVCTSVQRLYVHHSVYDECLAMVLKLVQSMQTGDPSAPGTQIGPMISTDAAERAVAVIERASRAGATIHCGGQRHGAVVTPAVLTDVPADQDLWCKEAFAPVLALRMFDRIEEAFDDANNTPYGLSAGIFTQNVDVALKAARSLRFGTVQLNESSSCRADAMPFGGVKDSGFGKEGPAYAVHEMTEERLVIFNP